MNTYEKDDLVRELRARSEDIGGHPIAFEQIKQSARKIQRRRRIASGAVAAMALAVAVPTALSVTSGINSAPLPAETPSPNPTPSVTETAAPRPDGPVVITTEGLPRGTDPQLSYIVPGSDELVTPEGTFQLPGDYMMITPFDITASGDGGWLAIGTNNGGTTLEMLDTDFDAQRVVQGSMQFVVNEDGTQVAYTERDPETGEQVLANAATNGLDVTTWPMPDSEVTPVGFLPGMQVLFQTQGEDPLIGIANGEGTITELDGFNGVSDASESSGLVAGQTLWQPLKECYGVMDPTASTSETIWETCDYTLGDFSPNGQYVLGGTPGADAMGSPSMAVLDAQTGDVVVEFEPPKGTYMGLYQVAWESNDSLLAMVYHGDGDVIMVRAHLDGRLEQVGPTGQSRNMNLPFWFADVPRTM